ncbi:hypothetical protein ATANTOWER_025114 [Ataeniobius toweri]|uniref:Uncharacterized protein n=1 Tax=Ataeniobius toweri TaxID=208326 RepID=A0ABU7A7Z0_9TELE|nr:hypothetical protein [Ataeniobius toweri]
MRGGSVHHVVAPLGRVENNHRFCISPQPQNTVCDQHYGSCNLVHGLNDIGSSECQTGNEKIPILQPGHFDGAGSWKGFLYQFECCAKANHWTEKTKAVQLKFCLTGPAGAIVHKNPR